LSSFSCWVVGFQLFMMRMCLEKMLKRGIKG
jgi:hypothetical protein